MAFYAIVRKFCIIITVLLRWQLIRQERVYTQLLYDFPSKVVYLSFLGSYMPTSNTCFVNCFVALNCLGHNVNGKNNPVLRNTLGSVNLPCHQTLLNSILLLTYLLFNSLMSSQGKHDI